MTGQRRGYAIALVAAVLALVASFAAVIFMTPGSSWQVDNSAQGSSPEAWRQGLASDGWAGQDHEGGGMMGDRDHQDTPSITTDQAQTAAGQWAAANRPGATVGAGVHMPMGYQFTLTEDGKSVGTIIVNDDTGQVTWWGAVRPSPTASAS